MNIKSSKILIGITGGIAVYKVCTLINTLLKEGADIEVIMTNTAKKFVTPLTFESLLNKPIYSDIWNPNYSNGIEHINLSHWPDLVLIVPATANTISKISHGIADNLLTTVVLALLPNTPVLIAPAMNTNMWSNIITQKNIENLKLLNKFKVMEPRTGLLACRDEGLGKIPSNDSIIEFIKTI